MAYVLTGDITGLRVVPAKIIKIIAMNAKPDVCKMPAAVQSEISFNCANK